MSQTTADIPASVAEARERAGLTLDQAAVKVRRCPAYLRACERTGKWASVLAVRLARLYNAPLLLFFTPPGHLGQMTGMLALGDFAEITAQADIDQVINPVDRGPATAISAKSPTTTGVGGQVGATATAPSPSAPTVLPILRRRRMMLRNADGALVPRRARRVAKGTNQ